MSEDDEDPHPDIKPSNLPNVGEIKQDIAGNDQDVKSHERFLEEYRRKEIEGRRQYIHLRGLSDHYWHKGFWSYFIAFLMFVMIGFQCLLLYKVGTNAWNFEKYAWLLPSLLIQNLGQIAGLALFVVKALFKDLGKD